MPFLVVRAVDGDVAGDNPPYLLDPSGWFLQGTPEQWATLEQHDDRRPGARSTASPTTARPPPSSTTTSPGETALARQLAHQRGVLRVGSRRPFGPGARAGPRGPRGHPAGQRHAPSSTGATAGPATSSTGTSSPCVVLDWEMAIDRARPRSTWPGPRSSSGSGRGWPSSTGCPRCRPCSTPTRAVATYERLSGGPSTVWRGTKRSPVSGSGSSCLRMSLRSIAFGVQEEPADPNDLMMFPALLDRLLEEI